MPFSYLVVTIEKFPGMSDKTKQPDGGAMRCVKGDPIYDKCSFTFRTFIKQIESMLRWHSDSVIKIPCGTATFHRMNLEEFEEPSNEENPWEEFLSKESPQKSKKKGGMLGTTESFIESLTLIDGLPPNMHFSLCWQARSYLNDRKREVERVPDSSDSIINSKRKILSAISESVSELNKYVDPVFDKPDAEVPLFTAEFTEFMKESKIPYNIEPRKFYFQ